MKPQTHQAFYFSFLLHSQSNSRAWWPAPLSANMSTECKCTASQIETPICAYRATAYQFIWQLQQKCGALDRSPMECGVAGQHHETPYFHLRHQHPPPGITLPRTAWVRLNRLRTGGGRFRSCLHKWAMAPLRPVSVALKKKPPTIIDLHCKAWLFWMMRQLNGCSTTDSKSSAAKQWIERTGSSDEEEIH